MRAARLPFAPGVSPPEEADDRGAGDERKERDAEEEQDE
jgi:hypothetical protein